MKRSYRPNGITQSEAIRRCCSTTKNLDKIQINAEKKYGGPIQRTLVCSVRKQWERSKEESSDRRFSNVYRPKGITQTEAIIEVCERHGPLEGIKEVHKKAIVLYGSKVRYDLVSRVRRNWMVETNYVSPTCSIHQIKGVQSFLSKHGVPLNLFEKLIKKFPSKKELASAVKQVKLCGAV